MGSVRSSRSTKHTVVDVKKRCARSLHRRKGFGGRDPEHAQNTRTAKWFLWSCEVVLKNSPKKPRAAAEALVVVRGRA